VARQRFVLTPVIERSDRSLLARYRFRVYGGAVDSTATAMEVALVVLLWCSRLLHEACWLTPEDIALSVGD
jgi:hypothetical protein